MFRLIAVRDKLVWVDCEMTGLDLASDKLIEVAALVTDPELNVLGEGVDVVIHADDAALDGMPEVVARCTRKSGLTEEVRASAVTMAEAEEMVMAYVREHVKEPRTAPLCGNSIATDRGFLARDMPALDDYLHYRMIDVSSIKELCRRWYPRIYFGQPRQGAGPPGAGRHPGEHPRAGVLPPHRLRAPARPVDQRDCRNRQGSREPSRNRLAFRRGESMANIVLAAAEQPEGVKPWKLW